VLQVLSGNIEHVPTKEKAKFAQEFFPDVRSHFAPILYTSFGWAAGRASGL